MRFCFQGMECQGPSFLNTDLMFITVDLAMGGGGFLELGPDHTCATIGRLQYTMFMAYRVPQELKWGQNP